jgi:hypothetical protein
MELDIFLQEQNIRRYRKLLDASMGEPERQTILKLLAEEMKKMKSHHQTGAIRRLSELVPS